MSVAVIASLMRIITDADADASQPDVAAVVGRCCEVRFVVVPHTRGSLRARFHRFIVGFFISQLPVSARCLSRDRLTLLLLYFLRPVL